MLQKYFTRFLFLFTSLFILTVPFPHPFIPDIASYLHQVFECLVKWSGNKIFHIQHPYTSKLISDSTGLYIHLFNLAMLSASIGFVWTIAKKQKAANQHFFYWFRVFISYYLALQLFDYGFNKLFKWQFYLPEPNTLFTSMGQTPRDLVYWSSMGLSRPYTIFVGTAELVAAVLLLFRRTRLAGALFAFFVLCNVVAVNFSYDISVKVYSCFLLLLCCIIIVPDSRRLFAFFSGNKNIPEKDNAVVFTSKRSRRILTFLKIFVIAVMMLTTLSVYFTESNFNDDTEPRPVFHGAYDVIKFTRNGDTLPPLLTDEYRWRRAFVHRRGYFIVQDMADNMQDYKLLVDTVNHHFIIEREDDDEQFKINYKQYPDSTLSLDVFINKDSLWIKLKLIDLTQLPALKHEFNWTIDN